MSDEKKAERELRNQLLLSFHQQFAENQNHHQRLFFQMLTILLTVVIGYGYVYTNGGTFSWSEDNESEPVLAFSFVISGLMLALALGILNNMAYGFRRDQLVNSRIRKKTGLLDLDDDDSIFPRNFDPVYSLDNKVKRLQSELKNSSKIYKVLVGWWWKKMEIKLAWMPNFHAYHFFIIMCVHLVLVVSFLFNPYDAIVPINPDYDIYWPYVLALSFYVLTILFVLRSQRNLYKKLRRLYRLESGMFS